MKHALRNTVAALALAASSAVLAQQGPVKIVGLVELSGGGATAGTNFDNGVKLAVKEINAAGGILGRKIDVHLARHADATPASPRRSRRRRSTTAPTS